MIISVTGLLMLTSFQTPFRELPTYTTPLRDQVTLSLTSDRTSYYVKEPVSLKLTLRNTASTPVLGMFMISPISPKADLRYRRSGATLSTFRYPGHRGMYLDSPVLLEPDREISDEVLLGFDPDRQEFLLAEPGHYEFQVIYTDRHPAQANTVVESNVLVIEAQFPPARESEALRSYSDDLARVAQFDPRWWRVSVETMRQAARFLERFPHSAYAEPVRYGLMWALRDRIDGNRGSVSAEEKALYERLKAEKQENP